MILTAAKSNWERNEYQRTWRDGQYIDKFSWRGQLKDMHLFSRNIDNDNDELWVPNQHSDHNQKVVDSCSVTVNYVGYSPIPANVEIPAKLPLLDSHEKTINTLTLNQEKLEIFTTPNQYLQALDMVTSLFLHVEPGIKERWEREVLSRFQHQLSEDNSKEQMKKIIEKLQSKVIELQNEIRRELENVRSQELSLYNLIRERDASTDEDDENYKESIEELSSDLNEHRKYLNNRSEEMSVTLKMAKETELKHQILQEAQSVNEPHSTRRTHLSFHEIQWNLNDKDGRIAHFVMKNFEYLSVASVDSVLHEQSNQQHVIHEFKIRDFELQNLLPDQIFRIVLQPEDRPTENTSHNYSAVRVLCKVKPPVNGLRIKEHIEVRITITKSVISNKNCSST